MRKLCHPMIVASFASALTLAALISGCGGSDTTVTVEKTVTVPHAVGSPTEAALKPVGEQAAKGTARYSLNPSRIPALQVDLEGLEPVSGLAQYAIWMYGDRHDMVILGAYQPDEQGRISARFEQTEAYSFVEEGVKTELLVTKIANTDRVTEGIAEAQSPWDPPIIGERVLQGTFKGPFVRSSQPSE